MKDQVPPAESCKKNGNGKLFTKFEEILAKAPAKAMIHTHAHPDPDAIGSQMGLAWLLGKVHGVDCDLFVNGEISHPQNVAMVNLLSPKLIPVEQCVPGDYDLSILVDTVPSNAADVHYDVVIDHHVELPQVENGHLSINLHTGSNCATIYALIRHFGLSFDPGEEHDQAVATALLVGIYTDNGAMLADRCTELDREAFNSLYEVRVPDALREIAKYKLPRSWVVAKANAIKESHIDDNVAVVGLGMHIAKNRDLIAETADEMLVCAGVHVSVAFAIVDGEQLQGSLRTQSAAISAAKLCKQLGEDCGGQGWGHATMGAYRYSLGGMSIRPDEDEATKEDVWKLINKREKNRIFKILKK